MSENKEAPKSCDNCNQNRIATGRKTGTCSTDSKAKATFDGFPYCKNWEAIPEMKDRILGAIERFMKRNGR